MRMEHRTERQVMITFKDWQKNNASTEVEEGVNPTDFDSVGMDQDLRNAGVPFDGQSMNTAADAVRDRDDVEREYQIKLHALVQKRSQMSCEDDPNKTDPTAGPRGETSGGTVDANIRRYLKNKVDAMKAQWDKENKARAAVPVKATGTGFKKDPRGVYKRDDEDPGVDKSGTDIGRAS